MKKYSDVLAEQAAKHTPMTAEDLKGWDEWEQRLADLDGSSSRKKLIDEIKYLRSVLAECYMWMGRRVTSGSITEKYRWSMAEAHRIHRENKEMEQ